MSWQKELSKITEGRLKVNEPLNKHTTWKVGGPAQVLVEPQDLPDLTRIVRFSRDNKLPLFVIGAGSNLLVSDKGVKGVVIKLTSPNFNNIEFVNNYVLAGSGLSLNRLVNLTRSKGLSGCEFLAGIPGTLGGALVMNAGARDIFCRSSRYLSLADLVREIRVLDFSGREKVLKKREIKFGYRNSNLSKFIIISAKLKLNSAMEKEIAASFKKFFSYKKSVQDLGARSAGCVFKNPDSKKGSLTAGKMLDACGMKGKRCGAAQVSKIHANFILNQGKARARDILKLIHLAQKKVRRKFKVKLEPEVKFVGSATKFAGAGVPNGKDF